jgi:hypothetical protein
MKIGKVLNKYRILVIITLLLIIVLVIWLNRPTTKIYEFKQDSEHITKIENSDDYQLEGTSTLSDCNELGCYDAKIDYYRFYPKTECKGCPDESIYAVIVQIVMEPKDEDIVVERVSINSNLKEFINNVDLIIPQDRGKEVKLSKNEHQIAYEPDYSLADDVYSGHFKFYNNPGLKEDVKTYFSIAYPNSEEVFKNTIHLKLVLRDTNKEETKSFDVDAAIILEN